MTRHLVATLAAMMSLAGAAHSEIRTSTLRVGMTCPVSDPPVYELALTGIEGVSEAIASYEEQRIAVTYDDQILSMDDLVEALENLGLAAEPAESEMEAVPGDDLSDM